MRVWTRGGVLAGWLLAAVLGAECARAQVATTTVQDTVTDASGAPASGTIVVSWAAFTTAAGVSVPAGSLSTTLGAGGALNVALEPNAGATPMGSYYTAVFHLSGGTTSREFWVVPVAAPGGGPAKLAGIRNQVLPTSMAMQTVSKQYVDAMVAKASTSGTAGGDLSGSYPNPTVAAVHATGGTLDGVTVGAATPAPGYFTVGNFTSSVRVPGGYSYSGYLTPGYSFVSNGIADFYGSAIGVGLDTNYNLVLNVNTGSSIRLTSGTGTTQWVVDTSGNSTQPGRAVAAAFRETLSTPASSSAACTAGDFTDDANFHYVCVAANSWKRVGLGSF